MIRRHRRKRLSPAPEWDGLCCYFNGQLCTPEQMVEYASAMIEVMDRNPQAITEDKDARRTPIGGMQYR